MFFIVQKMPREMLKTSKTHIFIRVELTETRYLLLQIFVFSHMSEDDVHLLSL